VAKLAVLVRTCDYKCLPDEYCDYIMTLALQLVLYRFVQGGSNMSVSYGDTHIPHTVVGVCGEFQRTGRFLQRGI